MRRPCCRCALRRRPPPHKWPQPARSRCRPRWTARWPPTRPLPPHGLRGAINLAGLALAGERLNPEATFEIEKETPKQAFGVAVPLELGGKRAKRIAVSEATIRAGDAELAATIAQVRNDVRRAYYDVLVADARLTVLRELRDLSQRARDTAQARFEAGDAPRLEVLAGRPRARGRGERSHRRRGRGRSPRRPRAQRAARAAARHGRSRCRLAIDAGGPVVTERGA